MPESTADTIVVLQPEQTLPLRQQLLRPHQTVEACRFAGDDDGDTRHFGAVRGEELRGIVSIYRASPPQLAVDHAWQVRAMGVQPECRRQGLGQRLLQAAINYAAQQGGRVVWCNAREVVLEFYLQCGFRVEGERFEIEGIGPHYLMWHPL